MHTPIDVAARSLSRRSFFRMSAGVSALASLPMLTEAHFAMAALPKFADPNKGIHIDANENPLGPSPAAIKAMTEILPRGGRYLFNLQQEMIETFAKQEGIDPECVRAYAGSSEPLYYSVLAFTDASKPLIVGDPGYEGPMWVAKVSGAPIIKVPLADPTGAASHDVKAMLAASSNPGLFYICNPNNPTGTITPRADIEHLVAGMPKGSVALIDEAYIHLCDEPRSIDFVKEGKDVIVLRTFSKLYGMAGIRMGFAVGKPELLKKFDLFGENSLPVTAMVAATASLKDPDLVSTRKKIIADTRNETLAWLKSQGYAVTPSVSNCFMLDTKRSGGEVKAAMDAKEVYIGRIWPAWPTQVRITVGTAAEMMTFRKTFTEVMASQTAGLKPAPLPKRLADRPFTHLS